MEGTDKSKTLMFGLSIGDALGYPTEFMSLSQIKDRCGDSGMTEDNIAAYLGIKRDTENRWISEKHMPAHKVGRLWKFKKEEIDDWVKSGSSGEPANH